MKKTDIITRLAPTPSGYLHRGNYYNFLLNWLFARKQGGKVFLRIDDLDSDRAKPEFVTAIFRDLEALGVDWDIGPSGQDDFYKNWSQKHRTDRYVELIKTLSDKGFTYNCNCSRKSLNEQGFSGEYPGFCRSRNLVFQRNVTAIRFNRATFGCDAGDPVILRKEGIPAYHIGSICDDIDYNITHVFRGNDLSDSTQIQQEIAQAAGLPRFSEIKFQHHRLLMSDTGQKLSKSLGNAVDAGHKTIFADFALWMGHSPTKPLPKNLTDLLELPLSII
ncbi:MAG: hypothetical protein FJ347_03070 [Sphingomonadales bacterium]|nr:hypothetical protein [Sphingomonadales bacterium]